MESEKVALQEGAGRLSKLKEKGLICVRVYFNLEDASSVVQAAEDLKFRRVGLPLKKQKEHGFPNDWEGNTDGMSRTLKESFRFWKENRAEHERLRKKEELQAQLAKLEKC